MNHPDLIITQHESCDYPIFRMLLKRNRDFFGKIIIYFSKHFREPVYTDFLKESMQDLGNILFLDPIEYKYGEEDWRNVSTNYMLQHSESEWVCSVEQDFFAKDWNKLFEKITQASRYFNLLGYEGHQGKNESYIHPSFWFIKRSLLEKTSKDFSAKNNADHFGLITRDVDKLHGPIFYIQDNGFKEWEDCYHLGGVNVNYLEFQKSGDKALLHRPEMFYVYNWWSMKAAVLQDATFLALCNKVDAALRRVYPEIEPEYSQWTQFYK